MRFEANSIVDGDRNVREGGVCLVLKELLTCCHTVEGVYSARSDDDYFLFVHHTA